MVQGDVGRVSGVAVDQRVAAVAKIDAEPRAIGSAHVGTVVLGTANGPFRIGGMNGKIAELHGVEPAVLTGPSAAAIDGFDDPAVTAVIDDAVVVAVDPDEVRIGVDPCAGFGESCAAIGRLGEQATASAGHVAAQNDDVIGRRSGGPWQHVNADVVKALPGTETGAACDGRGPSGAAIGGSAKPTRTTFAACYVDHGGVGAFFVAPEDAAGAAGGCQHDLAESGSSSLRIDGPVDAAIASGGAAVDPHRQDTGIARIHENAVDVAVTRVGHVKPGSCGGQHGQLLGSHRGGSRSGKTQAVQAPHAKRRNRAACWGVTADAYDATRDTNKNNAGIAWIHDDA